MTINTSNLSVSFGLQQKETQCRNEIKKLMDREFKALTQVHVHPETIKFLEPHREVGSKLRTKCLELSYLVQHSKSFGFNQSIMISQLAKARFEGHEYTNDAGVLSVLSLCKKIGVLNYLSSHLLFTHLTSPCNNVACSKSREEELLTHTHLYSRDQIKKIFGKDFDYGLPTCLADQVLGHLGGVFFRGSIHEKSDSEKLSCDDLSYGKERQHLNLVLYYCRKFTSVYYLSLKEILKTGYDGILDLWDRPEEQPLNFLTPGAPGAVLEPLEPEDALNNYYTSQNIRLLNTKGRHNVPFTRHNLNIRNPDLMYSLARSCLVLAKDADPNLYDEILKACAQRQAEEAGKKIAYVINNYLQLELRLTGPIPVQLDRVLTLPAAIISRD